MVASLEQGADDLHVVHLMLHPVISASVKPRMVELSGTGLPRFTYKTTTIITTVVLRPFVRDYPGESVPEG